MFSFTSQSVAFVTEQYRKGKTIGRRFGRDEPPTVRPEYPCRTEHRREGRTLNYIYDRQRPDPTALVSPTGSKSSRRQSYKAVFEGIADFTDTEAAALRRSAGVDRTVWTPESGPDQDEAPTWEEIAAEMRSNCLSRLQWPDGEIARWQGYGGQQKSTAGNLTIACRLREELLFSKTTNPNLNK
ncbi:hypothetical protein [Alistipes communis]|uniref:hypothetical protein n=1 Tax=Alistipes communis TaxID=2585118 RepID=UPI003FD8B10A